MNSDFLELNLLAYHVLLGLCLDAVIWCLGPLVDDSREYGLLRCCLALATRRCCRTALALRDLS